MQYNKIKLSGQVFINFDTIKFGSFGAIQL